MALGLSAVLLGCRLDGTASLGQIPWDHHRMYLNTCVQRKEPWLGNRRDLGGILHFEKKIPRSLTIGVCEISGFRLQIRQDGLDGCAKLSGLRQFVPCFYIHDDFKKKSHRSPPDVSQTSHVNLDSINPSKFRHETWRLTFPPEASPSAQGGFPPSTAPLRNPFFGSKKRVVCTGFTFYSDSLHYFHRKRQGGACELSDPSGRDRGGATRVGYRPGSTASPSAFAIRAQGFVDAAPLSHPPGSAVHSRQGAKAPSR